MSGSGWVETLRRFNQKKKAEKDASMGFIIIYSTPDHLTIIPRARVRYETHVANEARMTSYPTRASGIIVLNLPSVMKTKT